MNKGWVKLHRDILDWEWYKRPNIVSVFIHCLLKTNHKDKKWQGTLIKRGQFVTSYKNLSNELSGKQAGLTVMQVRTAISKLKLTGEITTKATNKYTIITVNNYDRYQQDNKQDNKQITNKQQTNNKQITTNKNIKNIKNENKEREKPTQKKWGSIKSIREDTEKLNDIAKDYKVPIDYVYDKLEDLELYVEAHGKSYRDYNAALRNFVKGDKKKDRPGLKKPTNEIVQDAVAEYQDTLTEPYPLDWRSNTKFKSYVDNYLTEHGFRKLYNA